MSRNMQTVLPSNETLKLVLLEQSINIQGVDIRETDTSQTSLDYSCSNYSVVSKDTEFIHPKFQKNAIGHDKTLRTYYSNKSTNPTMLQITKINETKLRGRNYSCRILSKQINNQKKNNVFSIRNRCYTASDSIKKQKQNKSTEYKREQKKFKKKVFTEDYEWQNYQSNKVNRLKHDLINDAIQVKTMGLGIDEHRSKIYLKKLLLNRPFVLHLSQANRQSQLWKRIDHKLQK